jgi:phenylalanyl-tRNA synthetase beta chain
VARLSRGPLPLVEADSPPRFQPIERDLTVDAADAVPAAEISRVVRDSAGPLLRDARLSGTYRGVPLGPDERSLTYRLRFAAPDRTLADAEVDAAIAQVSGALEHHEGARIRS